MNGEQVMNYIKIATNLTLEQQIKQIALEEIRKINQKLETFPLPFDYQIELSEQDVSDCDYVGEALFSVQYDVHILPIAINFKLLADELFMNNNIHYIKQEILITLWHEIAHGLIFRIEDDGYDMPFYYDDEDICEEFGKSKGNLNNSKLGKWIKQFDWQIDED